MRRPPKRPPNHPPRRGHAACPRCGSALRAEWPYPGASLGSAKCMGETCPWTGTAWKDSTGRWIAGTINKRFLGPV